VLMWNRHTIAFGSRKFRESKRFYPIYDNEVLSIMNALDKFRN